MQLGWEPFEIKNFCLSLSHCQQNSCLFDGSRGSVAQRPILFESIEPNRAGRFVKVFQFSDDRGNGKAMRVLSLGGIRVYTFVGTKLELLYANS